MERFFYLHVTRFSYSRAPYVLPSMTYAFSEPKPFVVPLVPQSVPNAEGAPTLTHADAEIKVLDGDVLRTTVRSYRCTSQLHAVSSLFPHDVIAIKIVDKNINFFILRKF